MLLPILLLIFDPWSLAAAQPVPPAKTELETILGLDRATPSKAAPGLSQPPHLPSPAEAVVDQLVVLASQNHPGLTGQQIKVEESHLALEKAKGALWPVATASAGIGQSSSDPGPTKTETRTDSWGVSISQNLWRGGQDQMTVKLQELGVESAEVLNKQKRKTVEWKIRLAALAYNQAAMDLEITKESLKNSSEILELSRQKVQAGQAGKIDLMQSQMQNSEANNQIAAAEIQLDQTLSLLETELLVESRSTQTLKDILAPLRAQALPWPVEKWLESSEKNSSKNASLNSFELTVQHLGIQQKDLELQKDRRDRWFPTLDLNLSLGETSTDTSLRPNIPDPSPEKNTSFTARLDLRWTIWDYSKHIRIAETAKQRAFLESQQQETLRGISIGHQSALDRLARLGQLFTQKKLTFSQAESLYQARLQLYRAGAIGIIEVTTAANERLRNLQSLYGTIRELQTEWYRLRALRDGVTLQ
jgi:outer membrane protein TolC